MNIFQHLFFNRERDLQKIISVLAVDDDPNMQRLIQIYLDPAKFDVTSVSSGKMALHRLETQNFDLLISDIQMPQMDGIDLVQEVRRRDSNLPVIIISAFGKSTRVQQILDAGADVILDKPFEQRKLLGIINKLLITN